MTKQVSSKVVDPAAEDSRAGPSRPAQKLKRGRIRQPIPRLGRIEPDSGISVERQVYGLVRRAIMAGSFVPGQSLSIRSIAGAVGVSLTPVVQALKRLEADGVLLGRDRSAFYLAVLGSSEFAELLSIRCRLEGLAAKEAAEKITPRDLKKVEAIQMRFEREGRDKATLLNLNFAFHFEIYSAARSPVLLGLIENLWMRVGPSLHHHDGSYDLSEINKHHHAILEGLRAGDGAWTEKALIGDLSSAAEVIIPRLP